MRTGFKVQLNTVAWVEGDTPNATDPSGRQASGPGCGNKPCSDFLSEMYNIVQSLFKRYQDMLDDDCAMWEAANRIPFIGPLPAHCFSPKVIDSNWPGHQQAFIEEQQGATGSGGLEKAIRCYESKGMQKYNATGDASDTCNRNHATYQAALAWRAGTLSAPSTNSRNGGAPAPVPAPDPSSIMVGPPSSPSNSLSPNISLGDGILIVGVLIVGGCATALVTIATPGLPDEAATISGTLAVISGIVGN